MDEEKRIQNILFAIAERVGEEDGNLELIRDFINSKYPDLVDDLDNYSTEEEVNGKWETHVNEEMRKIEKNIETNREQYKDVISRVEKVKKTDIEDLAEKLDELVTIGKEYWQLMILGVLSNHTPKIPVNGMLKRQTLHLILAGDPSSGKTSILKIISKISPKATWMDQVTVASFWGVATNEGIETGLIDQIQDSVLLTSELKSINIPLFRQFLDNDEITIMKRGYKKSVIPNTVFFSAINPNGDWFRDRINLMKQVPKSEGELSRFDLFFPTMATKEKNESILDKWNIFSEMPNSIDLEEIGTILSDKARGMKTVKKIHLTKKQKETLKNVFRLHNKDLSGRRPILLTLRQFETLLRIVNIIVCSNFLKRRFEDGTVYAKDEDIDRAVKLYETIIDLKETVYCSSTRTIIDLKQKIYQEIIKANKGREVVVKELEKEVVKEGENGEPLKDNNGNPLGLCSRATLYRYIKELILDGTVKMVNRKPLKVLPI